MKNTIKRSLKRALTLILTITLLSGLTGCLDDEEGEIRDSSGLEILSDGAVRENQVKLKGDGTDTVTILVYMNGSNLESEDGEATIDLSEMIAAGESDQVKIVVQTMGTKQWDSKYGIASDRTQRFEVKHNRLLLIEDDLGQLDCTKTETLSDFIAWGASHYPADRYILQFWDHGGGPVYGFGYDEWNDDEEASLTIDEMQQALKAAGVYFDFIGMDCCLMSCLEVCCAFYDYCDYMILSEDFESGLGWAYTNWLQKLYENPSIDTVSLGKIIVDDIVEANETQEGGDKTSMSLIRQGTMKVLFTAWKDFAMQNEDELEKTNYSRTVQRRVGGRVHPRIAKRTRGSWYDNWNYDYYGYDDYYDEEDLDMAEYYVTDIMEVANSLGGDSSEALQAAIDATLIYVRNTVEDVGLTGLSVSLPYGDREFYADLQPIFTSVGIDEDYVTWLENFTYFDYANDDYYDHNEWDDSWGGWEDYSSDYDWSDWEYSDYDEEYWYDDYGFDDWEYEDSWNCWTDGNDYCDEWYDSGQYSGEWYVDDWYDSHYDDWYYEDYCYDYCGDYYSDDYCDDYYYDDDYYYYDDYYYDDDEYYYEDDDWYYDDEWWDY